MTWKGAQQAKIDPRDVEDKGEPDASFVADLPDAVTNVKAFNALAADLADELYRGQSFTLAYDPALKLYAQPGESERDFKIRCQQARTASGVAAMDKLRDKHEPKVDRIQDRLVREERASWRKTKLSIRVASARKCCRAYRLWRASSGYSGGGAPAPRPLLGGQQTAHHDRRCTADIKESEAEIRA